MSQEFQPDDKILVAKEVAKWLKVCPAKIYSWAKKGKIPHFYIGRNVRFRYSAVRKWIDDLSSGSPVN